MRARCADGPHVGQMLEFPHPEWVYDFGDFLSPLYWLINGADRHAYSLMENQEWGTFRLVYRDTF